MAENVKNTKNKRVINKKRVLNVLIWVIIIAIILSGVVTAFILNYNTSAPAKIEVLDDGSNVYIKADMNDNYLTYRFKFVDDDEKEIIIDSEENTLTIADLLSEGIVLGQTYQISVQYLSENAGNNSEYSESITWTVYTYLSSPVLTYDSEYDIVTWEEIENADYYKVHISGLDAFETTVTEIDMQSLIGGERAFYVEAYSNTTYYKASMPSEQLNVKIVHKLLPFESVSFDEESKILTIQGKEQLDRINVYLNETVLQAVEFDTSEQDDLFTFTIDLSLYYLGGMTVGASPATKDEYNVYEGDVIYADGFTPITEEV